MILSNEFLVNQVKDILNIDYEISDLACNSIRQAIDYKKSQDEDFSLTGAEEKKYFESVLIHYFLIEINANLEFRHIDFEAIDLIKSTHYAKAENKHNYKCAVCSSDEANTYILPFSTVHEDYHADELQSFSYNLYRSKDHYSMLEAKNFQIKTLYMSQIHLCEKCYRAIIENHEHINVYDYERLPY
jgi:hypothetical protein